MNKNTGIYQWWWKDSDGFQQPQRWMNRKKNTKMEDLQSLQNLKFENCIKSYCNKEKLYNNCETEIKVKDLMKSEDNIGKVIEHEPMDIDKREDSDSNKNNDSATETDETAVKVNIVEPMEVDERKIESGS